MKKMVMCFVMLCGFIVGFTNFLYATTIFYDTGNLGRNLWKYDYEVVNNTLLSNISEFTIYFNYDLYDNLNAAGAVSGWNDLTANPDNILGVIENGFYDSAASGAGIAPNGSQGGFSVNFDWFGTGEPGSQFFEIVNPLTFEAIDKGYTVPFSNAAPIPEPATVFLFLPAFVSLAWHQMNGKRL